MEIKKALNKLKRYDFAKVFSVGLYNRFKDTERRCFDHIPTNLVGFIDLLDQLENLIKFQIGDPCFICIRTSSYDQVKDLNKELLTLSDFGIKLPNKIVCSQLYSDDDELYYCYSFLEWEGSIKTLLWLNISGNYPNIKPMFDLDLFFVSKDVRKIINVYDDRGLDILNLP